MAEQEAILKTNEADTKKLNDEIALKDQEISEWIEECENIEKREDALKIKNEELLSAHAAELGRLSEGHADILRDLKSEHLAEIQALEEKTNDQIEILEGEKSRLLAEREAELEQAKESYSKKVEEYLAEISDLKREFQERLEKAEEFEDQARAYQAKVEELEVRNAQEKAEGDEKICLYEVKLADLDTRVTAFEAKAEADKETIDALEDSLEDRDAVIVKLVK